MHLTPTNWGAVLTAIASQFILGGLWYSPALFMKPWLRMSGVPKPKFDSGLPMALLGDLFASFVLAFFLEQVIRFSGASSLGQGLLVSFGIWLGFVVPALLASVTYEHRPVNFFLINAGYRLVGILLVGSILTTWR